MIEIVIKSFKYDHGVSLQVNSKDTIHEVKRKLGQYNCILKFDGEILKNDKTIEYYNIEDGDTIVFNNQHQGGEVGSQAKELADPTKKGPVKYSTISDGPFYLNVDDGLNLFGPCNNKKCIAYNKEVCSTFGFGTFDLIKDLGDNEKCPRCPACEFPLLKLETCGFKKCKYNYIGTKIENKTKLIPVNYFNSISEDDKLDYFQTESNEKNKIMWIELKISANPL